MKKKSDLKNIIIIVGIYCLAHVGLVIINGRWWDDWTFYPKKIDVLRQFAYEIGRPDTLYSLQLFWNIPNERFRVVLFVMFGMCSVLLYFILKSIKLLNDRSSCVIAAMFSVVPVNIARVLFICTPYSLGFFLFWIGFFVLSRMFAAHMRGTKSIFRILSLLFFLTSFTLNSLLFFYVIVLFYILYMEYENCKKSIGIKEYAKELIKIILRYLDFILIPVVFFTTKNIFFPAIGRYENYNKICFENIISAVYKMPIVIINIFKSFLYEIATILSVNKSYIVIGLVLFILFCSIGTRIKKKKNGYSVGCFLAFLIIGVGVLAIGIFPYNVVRCQNEILLTGVGGRDSMLCALGVALIVFSLSQFFMKSNILCIAFIIFGIVECNYEYLEWQKDYYEQEGLAEHISEINNIADNGTIFYYGNCMLDSTRVYSLQGLVANEIGIENHFITTRVNDMWFLEDDDILDNLNCYCMKDFDINNNKFMGVILYESDLSLYDTAKIKYNEVLGRDNSIILDNVKFYYYDFSVDEENYISTLKNDGMLTDDLLYEYVANQKSKCELKY